MFQKLRAAALVALTALIVAPTIAKAAGFPVQFNASSPNLVTPTAVDVPQLGVARWLDSIRFDAASGASNTVQVELFDATSTATATTPFATFTVCTNTTNTNASAGTTGALMQGGNALLLLNYKINNRLFIAAAGNNPDSITGTVSVDNTRPTNQPSR